jgi:spore coat assembly protein
MGLNAIVKNIPENKQALVVRQLLERYNPDILIITGHDAMLKKGMNFSNIYNYRNSKNFFETVVEARKWAKSSNKLVIFAGACQSFFEALIEAGADFASSPGRILIDFIDPLIVAEKIAITDRNRFVSNYDIAREIKEGEKGISGIGAMGKSNKYVT